MSVFIIPKPASEDHITRYREMRLASLFMDPEAFGSRLAGDNNSGGESSFTPAQWEARVNTPGRVVFVAVPNSEPTPLTFPSPSPLQQDTVNGVHNEPQWAGTLSLISPSMLAASPKGPSGQRHLGYPDEVAEAERRGDAEVWMLVGMWVRPEYRGRSVARVLIERAFEFVRQAKDELGKGVVELVEGEERPNVNGGDPAAKRRSGKKDRIVMLRVRDFNAAAIALYEKAGFKRTRIDDNELEDGQQPGQSWMGVTLTSTA